MITILPDFYDKFQCKAGDCLHSCCKGWEIDIDDYTAESYHMEKGPFGEVLRKNIRDTEEGASFILTEDESCPFLQENGLCRIILEKGEEALCDICSNHPRFFTYFGDYELAGVGLCCEMACGLLLASEEPLRFHTADGGRTMDFSMLLEELGVSWAEGELCFQPSAEAARFDFITGLMERTEPINEAWTEALGDIKKARAVILRQLREGRLCPPQILTRIYQMLLYRQLEALEEYSWQELCAFAAVNTQFILYDFLRTGDLNEAVRRWSEQIEYDTDNVELLYGALWQA